MPRLSALLLSLLAALPVAAATPEEDVQRYIAIFEGGADSDRAVDDLAWMGISDTRLYDVVERRLLADSHGLSMRQRQERNHVARLIKAMGFSGQPRYEAVLTSLAADYRHPVERALLNLKLYQRWNPIISSRANWDPALSDDVNRVRNMLGSDDLDLQALGAKRVFFALSNQPVLLEMLAERVRATYKKADLTSADAVAWMVKAIGKSGDRKYAPLLQEVSAGTPNLKVSREADGWLRRM